MKNRAAWAGVPAIMALSIVGVARADPPAYEYEALAYLGAPAPGGGAFWGAFKPGAVGNEGEVAYVAGVDSGGGEGLFLDTVDGIFAIAGPGAPAAAGWQLAPMPGAIGGVASPVSMNAAGDLVFTADLVRGDQTGSGAFIWKPDTRMLTALALPGQGTPWGVFGNAHPSASIADNGDIAFAAELATPGGKRAEGVFLLAQGEITPVALPGDPEPGGGTFVRASRPMVNDQGAIAFQADVIRQGRSSAGAFLRSGTRLAAVAEAGMLAPEGGVFRDVAAPRLNNRGDLAFFGNTGEWAVYVAREGRLTRVIGPRMPLPGGDSVGALVAADGSLTLNQEGALATVLQPENGAAAGIYLFQGGALWPVALSGTLLAGIGPLDQVGPDLALNDRGQVAFQAELAGGQVALVLASPVPDTSGSPK